MYALDFDTHLSLHFVRTFKFFSMLVSSLLILCASWFVWCVATFLRNLRAAKKLGFPIVTSLVSGENPFWMVFGRLFRPLLSRFPRPIRQLAFYNTNDWTFRDQGQLHDDLGPIITHVSPGTNELLIADAALCDYILARRKEFIKPVSLLGVIYFPFHGVKSPNCFSVYKFIRQDCSLGECGFIACSFYGGPGDI
jgi:hypothetical protein